MNKVNILLINFKGGAAKTTNSSIVASNLPNATLLEIDKINESDSRINSEGYYLSEQIDFNNETSDSFFDFENRLLDDGIKVLDIGAVKLEIFHKAMIAANLYDTIDLLIIPAMDGSDDFGVAMNYLETIKNDIAPEKIMFSFNRFNNHEYESVAEQFDSFFLNTTILKKEYKIDLKDENNWYALKDSKAVKIARKKGITIKSLVEKDLNEITARQRAEKDKDKRLELTKERSLINNAQKFSDEFISPMITKIIKKLDIKG